MRIALSVFIVLIFAIGLENGSAGNNKTIVQYDLSKPAIKITLPPILHEISGITIIDNNTFACIQDENGILFIYDVHKNEIKHQYRFNINGDYEGITRVGNIIYVLRSDGTLFEISDYHTLNFKLSSYHTGIPANNNEGLCYDKEMNRLLVACKGKIGKGSEFKDKRFIYAFDLGSKTLSRNPVFDFDLSEIKQFAVDNEINLPVRSKKKGQVIEPIIKFNTSAICIHPITRKLYLLSAADHLLFVFNMNGKVEHIEMLSQSMFNKAEGISFFENGDMLISNEGQQKQPTLLRFTYK